MAQIADSIARFHSLLPQGVELVAVSKFHPLEQVMEAYAAGQRRFGESRADELAAKAAAMPADVEWHFIGHLQTNKARRVVAHASTVESVDSGRLLDLLEAEAARIGKRLNVLLQVHVAAEETKTGFTPAELIETAKAAKGRTPHLIIKGVMGMATNTENADRVRRDFTEIARTAARLREIYPEATEISMGMSGDWPLAVECGATLVRIGTDIFGERN